MRERYLLSAEIKTRAGQLLDYGILEATRGSTRLITLRLKGTALGGLSLVSLYAMYFFAIVTPFVFLRVPSITQWSMVPFTVFIISVPAGFFLIIFGGFNVFRRIEVRYPKSVRTVKLLEVGAGTFSHDLVVQSDDERIMLTIKSSRKNLLAAAKLSELRSHASDPPPENS